MKKFILIMLIGLIGTTVFVRQDPLADGRYRLFNKDWQCTGYIVKDRLNPDRMNIYDRSWHRTGYIERDRDRWDLRRYDKK